MNSCPCAIHNAGRGKITCRENLEELKEWTAFLKIMIFSAVAAAKNLFKCGFSGHSEELMILQLKSVE